MTKGHASENGSDELGNFIAHSFEFKANSGLLNASIRLYTNGNYVVFRQHFINGVANTSNVKCSPPAYPPVPNLGTCFNETVSGFPSFLVQQPNNTVLGFLSLGGKMFGDFGKLMGRFVDSDIGDIADGMRSGPIAVFDETGETLLIASLSNFMSSSMWYESAPSPRMSWGIMGGINNIPQDYGIATIVVHASGINQAFQSYGNLLRRLYKTDLQRLKEIEKDKTIHYLGYWTDNGFIVYKTLPDSHAVYHLTGAFYYYHPEPNVTYENTLKDVRRYSEEQNIPYRYLQLDSWWYYKNNRTEALREWTARPDIFPNGIRNLSGSTKWPIAAHNRYWSNDIVYAKSNGGRYNFITEYILSIPDDQIFWNDLIFNATKWGLILYEQDWLNIQTLFTAALQTDLHLGDAWLEQMGNAAKLNNISLQYCMALPRHALKSVQIPQVTQVRVSEDYLLEPNQWKIGISSIFAYALNVRPYKDTFWTSQIEQGNPKYNGISEPSPALQCLVSTLSTGPVGPGDKIGMVNKTILMRCCRDDGLILKPSKPATAIDRQIIKTALTSAPGPEGEVWTTYTKYTTGVLKNVLFGVVLAADMKSNYQMKMKDTGFMVENARVISYNSRNDWYTVNTNNNSMSLNGCTLTDFCLLYVTTNITLRDGTVIYIIGEKDKWVPVSQQRIHSAFQYPENTLRVFLKGTSTETVTMDFFVNDTIKSITCPGLDVVGTVYMDVVAGKCSNANSSNMASSVTESNLLLSVILFFFFFLLYFDIQIFDLT